MALRSNPLSFICRQCQAKLAYGSNSILSSQRRFLRSRPGVLNSEQRAAIFDQQLSLGETSDLRAATLSTSSVHIPPATTIGDVDTSHSTSNVENARGQNSELVQDPASIPYEAKLSKFYGKEGDAVEERRVEPSYVPISSAKYYVAAKSWTGLRSLKPSQWDAMAEYEGFNARDRILDDDQVHQVVRQVCVEILALLKFGESIDLDEQRQIWSRDDKYEDLNDICSKARFAIDINGQPQLILEDEADRRVMLEALMSRNGEAPDASTLSDLVSRYSDSGPSTVHDSSDTSPSSSSSSSSDEWRSIPLVDQDFKFQVFKRCTQLLGTRLADPQINKLKTVGHLAAAYCHKPKPVKLAEAILKAGDLAEYPNVQISTTKRTGRVKDEEIGRAKLIREAWLQHGIPEKLPAQVHSN